MAQNNEVQQVADYRERQRDKLKSISLDLDRVDIKALKKIFKAYEGEWLDKLLTLNICDTDTVKELHAAIKGAGIFVGWIGANKKKLEG